MIDDKHRSPRFWQDLADLMELSTGYGDGDDAINYINFLIQSKKQLPKRLLWELQQTKRFDVADMLFFLYQKYLRYRTKTVKCKCGYFNMINNFYQIKCCNSECDKMLGKSR